MLSKTSVKHNRVIKDNGVCRIRKWANLSCRGCVCQAICYPDYELYDKNKTFTISEYEYHLLTDNTKTDQMIAEITGIKRTRINQYRRLIKKGEFKDVRKVGP